MTTLKSIFVLADSDMKNTRALRRGIALAKNSGARLMLGMIVHDPRIDAVGLDLRVMHLAQRSYLNDRREWLEERRIQAKLSPAQITTRAIWSPGGVEAFLEMVRDCSADLVIKDASCGDAVLPSLLTPLDWKLLRLCPVPLMLLSKNGPLLPHRITAAVDTASDPDGLNQDIIRSAQSMTGLAGAELHLASAFPSLQGTSRVYPMVEQALHDAELKHNQTLEALRAQSRIEKTHCRNLRGDTLQTLCRFLEAEKMDMVVVGSIYRRGFERLLLGSTAESLLLQAPCDVLLVKGGRRTEKTRTRDSVKQQAAHK